jgi:hypothetical protein
MEKFGGNATKAIKRIRPEKNFPLKSCRRGGGGDFFCDWNVRRALPIGQAKQAHTAPAVIPKFRPWPWPEYLYLKLIYKL